MKQSPLHESAGRAVARAAVVVTGLALGSLAAPAFAAPPETWDPTDNGDAYQTLLLLAAIGLGSVLVIALLVYIPSMIRGQSSDAVALRDEPEWFGGPRKGAEAAAAGEQPADRTDAGQGGASASW